MDGAEGLSRRPRRAARRRLRLCVAGLLGALALAAQPAAAAAAPGFEWSLVSRFGQLGSDPGTLTDVEAGLPTRVGEHPVLIEPTTDVCAAGAGARWTLDGRAVKPVLRPGNGSRCAFVLAMSSGRHDVAVELGGTPVTNVVAVDDRVVVAIGDSVASGEGNPIRGARPWLDRRCHRSAAAGFEQAAHVLAEAAPRTRAITFVNLSCSGATVRDGLLGPYRGIEPGAAGSKLPSQLDRLADLDALAPVSAVLVSIGANDVHFARAVQHCIATDDCSRARFERRREDADQVVGHAIEELPSLYAQLADRLAGIVGGSERDSRRVLLSEYFDPTHGRNGGTCAKSLPGVTRAEAAWAYEAIMRPLNFEVAAAARAHHWRLATGIAVDFRRHGYCAPTGERWIRTIGEALARYNGASAEAKLAGTLHPNERGHLAIANRVAPELAEMLGLERPLRVSTGGGTTDDVLAYVAIGLIALVVLAALWGAIRAGVPARLAMIPRRVGDDPLPGEAKPFTPPKVTVPPGWKAALLRLGALLGAAILSIGFVAFVGALVVWLRFWSARIPADTAIGLVPRSELVATGAEALVFFGLLAVLAFGLVWLIDSEGKPVRSSRRGLTLLIAVELLAAIASEAFPWRQARLLIAGLVVGAILAHFLVDRFLRLWSLPQGVRQLDLVRRWPRALLLRPSEAERGYEATWRDMGRFLWRLAPLVALIVAVGGAAREEAPIDRGVFVGVPLLVAAVLFVAPGGIAATAGSKEDHELEAPRIGLAVATLAAMLVILAHDELWLVGTIAVAGALAGACLAVAAWSGERFLPYGLAVLVSVPLFGAALATLRAVSTPSVQPVAAVSAKSRKPVCGAYLGEQNGRLWLAHLELSELTHQRRPRPRLTRITSLATSDVLAASVGPLQPVARAQVQALVMRDALVDELSLKATREPCVATAPEPKPAPSRERSIAERVQPELVVDRRDGFWPISVRTLFAMQNRRNRVCRKVDDSLCISLRTPADLPWSGGDGESMEFPAADNVEQDQHDVMIDALGSVDPERTASEYFLVTGGETPDDPMTVQYWFFYSFNYQPLGEPLPVIGVRNPIHRGGFHEGDFETVSVLLSACDPAPKKGEDCPPQDRRPRYVWMARHRDEGRMFSWDEPALQKATTPTGAPGNHVRVYAARGSHASYERCDTQYRPAGHGLIDDHPACDPKQQLFLAPESTPITDLSRVSWACWRGLFGHRRAGTYQRVPEWVADAPLSPLWQQRFGGVVSEPCRSVPDPGNRRGLNEEVLPDDVAAALRANAGRLDPLADGCADWEKPPVQGSYLMACDPDALRGYFQRGLRGISPRGLRIDVADTDAPVTGPVTIPAVRRDPSVARLDDWRVVAGMPTRADVYASCQDEERNRVLAARFVDVDIEAATPLRVDDRQRGAWRLRRDDGTTVARAAPALVGGGKVASSRCTDVPK